VWEVKPLKVALIHCDNPRQFNRMVGFWAYDVPEFAITHYAVERAQHLYRSSYRKHDIIIREDHRIYGPFHNNAPVPLAYYVGDSTASRSHYLTRRKAAQGHDLILVDHDKLGRWTDMGVPVRRFVYCVNDKVFYDYGLSRDVDVCAHWHPTPERDELMAWLRTFCSKRGYRFAGGKRGQRDRTEYPQAFNRARISINLCQTPANRPHRVLDVMATRSCLVTSPLPSVPEDDRVEGVHYREFKGWAELGDIIDDLLTTGRWQEIADAAYELAHTRHTWAVRAGELRATLLEVFPQLKK
jgi:hypothetical protein